MRWISVALLVILFTSCKSLKPVIGKKTDNTVSTRNQQPRFIENITARPTTTANVKPSGINNSSVANTFTVSNAPEAYIPIQFKYAILMDVPLEALNNLHLFAFIDDWYGTPYRFGGNAKDGIDCSAFACNLMTTVFGTTGLPRMAKDQYKACEHVKRGDLAEGDLVFFHTTRKGISHVGVYLGNNKFVHASLNYGVTISDLNDPYYSHAFRAGGRMKNPPPNP